MITIEFASLRVTVGFPPFFADSTASDDWEKLSAGEKSPKKSGKEVMSHFRIKI